MTSSVDNKRNPVNLDMEMKHLRSRRSFLQGSLLLGGMSLFPLPHIGTYTGFALSPGTRLRLDTEDRLVVAWLGKFSSRHAFTGGSLTARQKRASTGHQMPSAVSMIAEVACLKRFAEALGSQRGIGQIRADGNRIVLRQSGRSYEIDCLLPKDYERTRGGNPVVTLSTGQQTAV